MRRERPRFQLRMELHPDKPGMIVVFDNLRQDAVRRHAGEPHAALLEAALVGGVDLIAMPVTFRYFGRPVNLGDVAAAAEQCRIGTEPHRAAEIAAGSALLELVALEPLRHEPDDRFARRGKLGRIGFLDAAQIPRRLDDGHLHPKADAEIRDLPLPCELSGPDLALGPTLTEATRHQDAVDMLKEGRRIFVFEYLRFNPV